MRAPVKTTQFKKDVKRCIKRRKDMAKFTAVLDALLANRPLDPKLKDHALTGEWLGFRDCHLEPDWVLIYAIMGDEVHFQRMGTHADLFE